MKTKTLLTIGLLALSLVVSNAQANNPGDQQAPEAANQENLSLFDKFISLTNWTVLAGYGHSVTGTGKNLAFQDFVYTSETNANVGVVVGLDQLWGSHQDLFCTVKGGATLRTQIHPFQILGVDQWKNKTGDFLGKIVITPFVANLVAQAKGNNAVGNITTAGFNYDRFFPKNFKVGAGFQWEYRAGQGSWDGNYLLFHIAVTRWF